MVSENRISSRAIQRTNSGLYVGARYSRRSDGDDQAHRSDDPQRVSVQVQLGPLSLRELQQSRGPGRPGLNGEDYRSRPTPPSRAIPLFRLVAPTAAMPRLNQSNKIARTSPAHAPAALITKSLK